MNDKSDNNEKLKKEAGNNEAWFADLVEHACDLVQCVDSQGRIIYANQAWLTALKYIPEEIESITLWEIIHPDSMEHCMAVFKKVLTGQTYGAVEAVFVAKDGTPVMVEGNVNVKLDKDGQLLHTRGIFRDVTKRKRTEEALKKQKEEYRHLYSMFRIMSDTMPDMLWAKDLDRNYIYTNKAICKNLLNAKDTSEPIGKNDLYFADRERKAHPKNPDWHTFGELCMDSDAVTLEEMKPMQFDEYGNVKGKFLYLDVHKAPLFNDEGELIGVVGTARDVTKQKINEEALRESEEKHRFLAENMGDIIWTLDLNFKTTFVSPSIRKILGYTPEERKQQTLAEVMTPESQIKSKETLRREIVREEESDCEQDRTAIIEVEYYHQNGSTVWMENNMRALRDKDGRLTGIYGVSRDITERKQSEEALKASEQKYREILSTMEEGYYEVDLAGNLVFFNESFRRMTGRDSDELIGRNYKQFYKNSEEVFKTFNQVYREGKSVTTGDWLATDKDGREYYLEVSISLRHDENGQPIGFRGVVRDVTERRKSEEKIRYLSFHDQLTGLYNRHFLDEEMKRFDSERQLPISIIMADLNGLKLVNDTYGHQTGDEMLKLSALILKNSCRDSDLLARFGGDEFVLYLPRTSEAEAQKICERIEKTCHNTKVKDVPLSLSTGFAVKERVDQEITDLLKEAENKMYRNKLTESRSGKSAIVKSLLQTLAAKSYETETHTQNMQQTARSIGEKIGLPHSELHRLQLLITLHDIGKINIPEELLTKRGSLSNSEWEKMKMHSETGYRIAKSTEEFAHVAEDILSHHECWDGSGYPQGLKGDIIPLLARITAIADAFEVMNNGRPYKKAMRKSEIIAEFQNCSGTQFDPALVEIFLPIIHADR